MRLVGSEVVDIDAEGIDFGDLPTDGSYKWMPDKAHWMPIGHGFDKIKTKQPFETDLVLAKMIEAMGDAAPFEAVQWLAWYKPNMQRRHEELAARPK